MTKIKTVWKCSQVSKFNGEKMVAGFTPVQNKKLNKQVQDKQPFIGEFKIGAESTTEGHSAFEDGKFYTIEICETKAPKED